MEKKIMRLDGLERMTELPPLDVWLARRLAALFPPVDCATAADLASAFGAGAALAEGDRVALLLHLTADGEPHVACPHGADGCEALLTRLRADAGFGADEDA